MVIVVPSTYCLFSDLRVSQRREAYRNKPKEKLLSSHAAGKQACRRAVPRLAAALQAQPTPHCAAWVRSCMSGLAAACWAACTALELKARCARDVPFAFTVVFRVATIRSRPDAVGKGTLLFLKAYISILNSVGNFKNPHLLLKKLTRASLGLPGFCNWPMV